MTYGGGKKIIYMSVYKLLGAGILMSILAILETIVFSTCTIRCQQNLLNFNTAKLAKLLRQKLDDLS